ncbi:MAG TPA: insulinase family protein [Micromonosporaceae bacterium]|nr:insulinase family protein [Micromonosporaceae bacterium]
MIRQTEVDGIPTLIAPASGPMHAGLAFRVGRADETLARGGITHLLEHLALHRLGLVDYHYNGATGMVMTNFHMQGSASDVTKFLNGVCAALNDLPLDRMEIEKSILQTEGEGRASHVAEQLALWRYGARNYGLVGYPEWGLAMLTPNDLLEWAARYFTRDNAVLWIAGDDVPPGLSLPLPAGQRWPAPRASSALPATPAFFAAGSRGVAFDGVVERSLAASVFAEVLERELFRALRQESGLSYTVGANYEPRGDGMAVVMAVADALPEKKDAVLGGFVDVLAKLRVGRVEQADVDAVTAKMIGSLDFSETIAARLPSCAFNLLTGYPNRGNEELRAELKAIAVDEVRAVAAQMLKSGLLMVPEGRRADWAGFTAAPAVSERAVSGHLHPSLSNPNFRLVVGAEGASLVGGQEAFTVRFGRCEALLAWPDGRRLLIGDDGISVDIEPTLYAEGHAAAPFLDTAVPAQVRVDMPARDPSEIPQPQSGPHPQSGPVPAGRGGRTWTLVKIWVLALVVLLFGGFSLLLTIGVIIDPTDVALLLVVILGGWLLTAYFAFAIRRNVRTLRGLEQYE